MFSFYFGLPAFKSRLDSTIEINNELAVFVQISKTEVGFGNY